MVSMGAVVFCGQFREFGEYSSPSAPSHHPTPLVAPPRPKGFLFYGAQDSLEGVALYMSEGKRVFLLGWLCKAGLEGSKLIFVYITYIAQLTHKISAAPVYRNDAHRLDRHNSFCL